MCFKGHVVRGLVADDHLKMLCVRSTEVGSCDNHKQSDMYGVKSDLLLVEWPDWSLKDIGGKDDVKE